MPLFAGSDEVRQRYADAVDRADFLGLDIRDLELPTEHSSDNALKRSILAIESRIRIYGGVV